MKIEKIGKRNWDYILFKVEEEYIITVIFFAQIDYPRSFHVTKEELNLDAGDVPALSERIRNNYEQFKLKEVVPAIMKVSDFYT